jgi:SAM-dependent methyltransferase
MSGDEHEIERHYASGGLWEHIEAALVAAGKDLGALSVDDLAPVDEFHTRGRIATRELCELAEIEPGSRVLDVGSGLGGPARHLATSHGCDVTGIDLSLEFCEVARELTRRTGLEASVRFVRGNALSLPFADESFDLVWTLQAQMNISDKPRFYREIARVLKRGGRFVFQDICAGNGEPLQMPVPWASAPGQSFLVPPPELRAAVAEAGLAERTFRDVTKATLEFRKAHPPPAEPPLLGTHLVLGERARDKQKNSAANLSAGRLSFVQGLFTKPG